MTAALLTNEPLNLLNLPRLADIATLSSLWLIMVLKLKSTVVAQPTGAVAHLHAAKIADNGTL